MLVSLNAAMMNMIYKLNFVFVGCYQNIFPTRLMDVYERTALNSLALWPQ